MVLLSIAGCRRSVSHQAGSDAPATASKRAAASPESSEAPPATPAPDDPNAECVAHGWCWVGGEGREYSDAVMLEDQVALAVGKGGLVELSYQEGVRRLVPTELVRGDFRDLVRWAIGGTSDDFYVATMSSVGRFVGDTWAWSAPPCERCRFLGIERVRSGTLAAIVEVPSGAEYESEIMLSEDGGEHWSALPQMKWGLQPKLAGTVDASSDLFVLPDEASAAVRWDGSKWQTIDCTTDRALKHVFAVGDTLLLSSDYETKQWSRASGCRQHSDAGSWILSGTSLEDLVGPRAFFDGDTWRVLEQPLPLSAAAVGRGWGIAYGRGGHALRRGGQGKWAPHQEFRFVWGLAPDGTDGVYVYGENLLGHYANEAWTRIPLPPRNEPKVSYDREMLVNSVAKQGQSLYIVFEGVVYKRIADGWRRVQTPPKQDTHYSLIYPLPDGGVLVFRGERAGKQVHSLDILDGESVRASIPGPPVPCSFDELEASDVAVVSAQEVYIRCVADNASLWRYGASGWTRLQADCSGCGSFQVDPQGRVWDVFAGTFRRLDDGRWSEQFVSDGAGTLWFGPSGQIFLGTPKGVSVRNSGEPDVPLDRPIRGGATLADGTILVVSDNGLLAKKPSR